jgi:NCS1 family nucleobase:cation symporter-1
MFSVVVATVAGCFFAWGGLVIPFLRPLYDYAWFVGFFAAGGLHVALMSKKGRVLGVREAGPP